MPPCFELKCIVQGQLQTAPLAKSGEGTEDGRPVLAICSDLDDTPDGETYFELMRFLNTTEETSMGKGVGLEVGNTIYFDMPPGHFSYWNTSDDCREKIRALIRSGHIDCLHSFGDLATTRAHAERALNELERYGCRIRVWIDHAVAPSNFGTDIMRGQGDDPQSEVYHSDLTAAYGINYVWRGRVTSVIGQDLPVSFRGVADWRHPISSARTILKESAKQLLGRSGNMKYRLNAKNQTLSAARMRDGQPMKEFLRCNPHWGGVSCCDRGDSIHKVLTDRFLDRLSERGGVCILYTHLGKLGSSASYDRRFNPAVVEAFRRLAEYEKNGRIRVTSTARLLDECDRKQNRITTLEQPPLEFPVSIFE